MPDEGKTPKKKIFLSYSSNDIKLVKHLAGYLEKRGLETWYAPRNIPPGSDWPRAIPPAIERCAAFILLFSKKADESKNVLKELTLAHKYEKPVFWLRLEDIEPNALTYFLSDNQWLDWLDKRDEALEELVYSILSLDIDDASEDEDGGEEFSDELVNLPEGGPDAEAEEDMDEPYEPEEQEPKRGGLFIGFVAVLCLAAAGFGAKIYFDRKGQDWEARHEAARQEQQARWAREEQERLRRAEDERAQRKQAPQQAHGADEGQAQREREARLKAQREQEESPRGTAGSAGNTVDFPATPFTVQVLISDLNIRAGAGANTEGSGHIERGLYTITEVRNGTWGRLKSGKGWIHIANPEWVEIRPSTSPARAAQEREQRKAQGKPARRPLTAAEYREMKKDADFAAADKALNDVWGQLKKSLSKASFAALDEEENQWIRTGRDAEAARLMESGLSRVEAYAGATRSRTEELSGLLAQHQGGGAVPASEGPSEKLTTAGDKINVYAAPATRSRVLMQIDDASSVTILRWNADGKWAEVRASDGTVGWVIGDRQIQN